ncbi:GNAT superfamily N-acetyltransferase [Salirhabdus euzebyi]|uniref:GNAT superfamily N-acetyltransferase n=1 Tax=Salirhabdus euzebyi TaxID=394506 RepID=A0A841PZB1_9BACI|nr:GNAT family N-acetyltransferase [Salirhabdus euzebyi]MBB6452671.1 GNAT superfamily N-acetyltransferase [Salirhabdus euzebyi]
MIIQIVKAFDSDAPSIFEMQQRTFNPLLEKYQDYDINPANEKIDKVVRRINHPKGGVYKILVDDIFAGAICMYWKQERLAYWISPMFISPDFQGKGIAQKSILLFEEMFPNIKTWELATIVEEKRNCYLYEKMGYKQTGEYRKVNENTTLVYYKKVCNS